MARRTAYLHLGLPHSGGEVVQEALDHHRRTLEDRGTRCPAKSADEMFRAAVELRRDHKAWGYRRRDVEGSWAAVCRRAAKGKGDVVISSCLLAGAAPAEAALLLDGLAAFRVEVVVTDVEQRPALGTDPDAECRDSVVARWAAALGRPDRVHVVVAPAGHGSRQATWDGLGAVVGFRGDRLPVPPTPAHGVRSTRLALRHLPERGLLEGLSGTAEERRALTEALLTDALVEGQRLRAANAALASRVAELERRRPTLVRRLGDALAG